ncbi:hypothetical protein ABEB36_009308 [Hypothenemus hampei]|uniref:Uncharacterized protein n=1 Tax=Hypothenemus hampei TaxID=57062 RepID=A0ABD1EFY6_HYPHA
MTSTLSHKRMDEQLAKELVKARNAVKRKYRALKTEIMESQIKKEKDLKPVTEPLKELIENIKTEKKTVKEEEKSLSPFNLSKYEQPLKLRRNTNIYKKYLPTEQLESNFPTQAESTVINTTLTEPSLQEMQQDLLELTRNKGYEEYLEFFDPLVRSFIDIGIKGERHTDHTHGIVHDISTEKFKIGNTPIDFEGPDLKLNNLTYCHEGGHYPSDKIILIPNCTTRSVTRMTYLSIANTADCTFGLPLRVPNGRIRGWWIVLSAVPDQTIENPTNLHRESQTYPLPRRTNAYRRHYDSNEQIQSTTDLKYLTIIKSYLREKGILKDRTYSEPSTFKIIKPPPQRPRTRYQVLSKKGGGVDMLNLSRKKIDYNRRNLCLTERVLKSRMPWAELLIPCCPFFWVLLIIDSAGMDRFITSLIFADNRHLVLVN